jgi:putative oxidoreductase
MAMVKLPTWAVDAALLALRLMIAAVFFSSGWSHAKDPAGRGKSIGMSRQFTLFLGVMEMAAALGVALGVLTQWAALGLIVVMMGAIHKKIFEWHTGFWGEKSSGWHYDLMFIVMCLVVIATGGGRWVLWG